MYLCIYIIKIHKNYTVDMLYNSTDILQLRVIIVVQFCSLLL